MKLTLRKNDAVSALHEKRFILTEDAVRESLTVLRFYKNTCDKKSAVCKDFQRKSSRQGEWTNCQGYGTHLKTQQIIAISFVVPWWFSHIGYKQNEFCQHQLSPTPFECSSCPRTWSSVQVLHPPKEFPTQTKDIYLSVTLHVFPPLYVPAASGKSDRNVDEYIGSCPEPIGKGRNKLLGVT